MGRKKKVSVNKVVTTRSMKQSSKSCESSSTPENSLDSDNASASQDASAENDSQDSSTTSDVTPLTHKKFGKYRCLLLNDSKCQSALGNSEDDSETGSNVEVRVVDPSISSESDSNPPAYNMSNQGKELKTFSKVDTDSKPSTSREVTLPHKLFDNVNIDCVTNSNCFDSDSKINLNNVVEFDTQLPDPTLSLISKCDPRQGGLVEAPLSPPSPSVDGGEGSRLDDHNGEEEMITVYEIIDENGSENMYFEMKTEDSLYGDSVDSSERVAVVLSSDSNSSKVPEPAGEYTHYNVDAQALNDFENRLSNINITNCSSNSIISSAECTDNKNLGSNSDNVRSETEDIISTPQCDTVMMESESLSTKVENVSENVISSSADSSCSSSTTGVRRSTRIKTISDLKQKSKGRGLVKASSKKVEIPLVKEVLVKVSESLSESLKSSPDSYPPSPSHVGVPLSSPLFPVPNIENDPKPVKVKSRWRRSSEMEMGSHSPVTPPLQSPTTNGAKLSTLYEHCDGLLSSNEEGVDSLKSTTQETYSPDMDEETQRRLKQFQVICENEYHCDRTISKEARKMTCDCFLTKDEIERGELGCGEDCLNRLLMIECNSRCPVGDRCTNRRFQSRQYSNLRVMRTDKKGLGLQAATTIHGGEFLMEYVGEVLNSKQFNERAEEYSCSDKNIHHYFMALKGDAVIDATLKGNISRFINHSCNPNAETQKWTVNGELRIGFFSKRDILPGEEITFDYQFQRYGKEAQKCYCEANNCRGWIGEEPDTESEEEEEEPEEKKALPEIKTEVEEGKIVVQEIKEEIKTEESNHEVTVSQDEPTKIPGRHKRRDRPKKFARAAKELLEDVDLEEDMEMLSRSGIKNQSHTLSLCRAMVRAKRGSARAILLTLLASADLPCRRLFLDYRGLRLLAPWCQDANAKFRLNMLIALEKLPIPNKTILQECNLMTYLQKWLSSASPPINSPHDDSDNSPCGTPFLIDESTGLPVELPPALNHKTEVTVTNIQSATVNDIARNKQDFYDSEEQKEEVARLCKLLLDRWSQLKEIFKIPKKERIEMMKEHERQANEPHNRRDGDKESTRVRKTRWEERYTRPERPTDNKKRSLPPSPSPDSSRKIKLDDRSPLSKEERRREFAERAAREEQLRKTTPPVPLDNIKKAPLLPLPPNIGPPPTWMPPPDFNLHPFGAMMMSGMPPPEFLISQGIPPNYVPMEYMQQKPFMMPYCGPPQHMYMPPQSFPMMGPAPPFPPPPPGGAYQNMGPPPGMLSSSIVPQGITTIPPPSTYPSMPALTSSQVMPSPHMTTHPPGIPRPRTPPLPHIVTSMNTTTVQKYTTSEHPNCTTLLQGYPPLVQNSGNGSQFKDPVQNVATPTDENQDNETDVIVPFAPVRLPSQWRSVKDVKGRTYYYHVKLRIPQWDPPLYSPTPHSKHDDSSSSEEDSSEEDDERDLANGEEELREEEEFSKQKFVEGVNGIYQKVEMPPLNGIDISGTPKKIKKARPGLVTGCWIISPRKEEDRIANQLELRKYKENKEKLRRKKEALLAAAQSDAIIKYKKKLKDRHKKSASKKKKESELVAEETARRRKEVFRVNMAKVMVQHLNPFRRDDCCVGRITNTADFKHLARKLTHFVMLKELKHCKDVNELECNDSVKQKAKEFVKKYMAKFGPVYERPPEEID